MPRRQAARSEETKRAILAAAGQLFAQRGFDAVTMREIAKAAGCSHTAIYIYFEDKEALLHHLAMGPLESLCQQVESALRDTGLSPEDRLRLISREFVQFCLRNRTMYAVLFMAKATRVDVQEPTLKVQQVRNQLFGLLRLAIQGCLPPGQSADLLLAYSRIHFYTLHGIISLYTGAEETYEQLMERLAPTFELAVEVMLAGFKQTAQRSELR